MEEQQIRLSIPEMTINLVFGDVDTAQEFIDHIKRDEYKLLEKEIRWNPINRQPSASMEDMYVEHSDKV